MEKIATLELDVTGAYRSLVFKLYDSKDYIGTENYERWDLGDITINRDVLECLGYGGGK